jgi:hypothetical protein
MLLRMQPFRVESVDKYVTVNMKSPEWGSENDTDVLTDDIQLITNVGS